MIAQNIAGNVLTIGQHVASRAANEAFMDQLMDQHKDWMTDQFFVKTILPSMQLMSQQMSAVAMHQVMTIGTFFDAEQQLRTQLAFQELQHQAHKDYQPSRDFCTFGTNVRSLAATEESAHYSTLALNARQMGRHLGNKDMAAAGSRTDDKLARWKQFTTTYCDPNDNKKGQGADTGLSLACPTGGAEDPARRNIDIDYTRLIDENRTLDVAFRADEKIGGSKTVKPDEEDVIALANNLYGHDVLSRQRKGSDFQNIGYQEAYLALRSVAAKRNVAENSYNAIVGLKSSGSSDITGDAAKTREFLGAILAELGVPDDEVYKIIGERPSYYAQLEILAKKIYQSPDFFAGLYDKPANVARKSVALKAIELMLDRAIYESQLRQEMATSVLLSSKLSARAGGDQQ